MTRAWPSYVDRIRAGISRSESGAGSEYPPVSGEAALADVHHHLGAVWQDRGDLAGARQHYERALALAEEGQDPGDSDLTDTEFPEEPVIVMNARGPDFPPAVPGVTRGQVRPGSREGAVGFDMIDQSTHSLFPKVYDRQPQHVMEHRLPANGVGVRRAEHM